MATQGLAEPPAFDIRREFANAEIDEVSAFLADHSFLTPILRDIAHEARYYFSGSSLSLKVCRDPDGVDMTQLAVYILTALAPSDSLKRLREFDVGWWLDNQHRARGLVIVDVAPA